MRQCVGVEVWESKDRITKPMVNKRKRTSEVKSLRVNATTQRKLFVGFRILIVAQAIGAISTLLFLSLTGFSQRTSVDVTSHSPESSANLTVSANHLQNYYIFAQGCIAPFGGGDPCTNPPQVDWHLYLDFLRDYLGFRSSKDFNEWAAIHL